MIVKARKDQSQHQLNTYAEFKNICLEDETEATKKVLAKVSLTSKKEKLIRSNVSEFLDYHKSKFT